MCKPDPDHICRRTVEVAKIYIYIVHSVAGWHNECDPILGRVVGVFAYVSYYDVEAAVAKYYRSPKEYHVSKHQQPVRAGVTYAGPPF